MAPRLKPDALLTGRAGKILDHTAHQQVRIDGHLEVEEARLTLRVVFRIVVLRELGFLRGIGVLHHDDPMLGKRANRQRRQASQVDLPRAQDLYVRRPCADLLFGFFTGLGHRHDATWHHALLQLWQDRAGEDGQRRSSSTQMGPSGRKPGVRTRVRVAVQWTSRKATPLLLAPMPFRAPSSSTWSQSFRLPECPT